MSYRMHAMNYFASLGIFVCQLLPIMQDEEVTKSRKCQERDVISAQIVKFRYFHNIKDTVPGAFI